MVAQSPNQSNTNVSQLISKARDAARQLASALDAARGVVREFDTIGGKTWTDHYFVDAGGNPITTNFDGQDIYDAIVALKVLSLEDGSDFSHAALLGYLASIYRVL